jgi:hypothetical protein
MSHTVQPVRRFARAIALVAAVASLTLAGLTLPAHAAPGIPGGLSASGSPVPTLSWAHVPGATQYVVELSKTDDVSQRIGSSVTTVNRHYVPTQPLPWSVDAPTLYWRVAAKDSVQGDFSTWQPVSTATGHAAPSISSPADDTSFTQPGDPATLTWDPLAGAQEYEVQISPDEAFTDPAQITIAKTSSTSYVVPAPQVDTTYWFKVRARLSTSTGLTAVYTAFSDPRSYKVLPLPAAAKSAPETDAKVDDAVLDWDPVLGARTYDLQIATDPEFGSIVHERTDITGTSYARPQTLNNDEYYWRVRAEDVAGNVPTWSSRETWSFERHWPEMPVPSYPARASDIDLATPNDTDLGVTVGDPFYYEWEPVPLASMYKIELASDPSFSTIVGTCYSRGTTYTPASEDAAKCMPGAEKTYWWRLTAMDQHESNNWSPLNYPMTSQNVFYDARFTYSPAEVTLISPPADAEVDIPTLTWEPLAGAARYRVFWSSVTASSSSSQLTAATSFTPPKLDPGDYTWQVVPVTNDGREGAPLLSAQRGFTVVAQQAATATFPEVIAPVGGSFARFPSLSWQPVVGAESYRVQVRVAGGSGFTPVSPTFAYPAGTDPTAANLAPGDYEWMVQALGSGGGVISTSPALGSFEIASPTTVTGQANALSMAGYQDGDTCTGLECTDLRQTPVLRWNPAADTGYYKVWISRNANLSNLVPAGELGKSSNPFTVNSTVWTPTTAMQESTAGQAYFWAVQPCTYSDKCAPNPVPLNSFNKRSHAVETTSPGVVVVDGVPAGDATIPPASDDLTLMWRDFLATSSTASSGSSSLTTPSTQTAREYEVQVAVDHTFATLLDSAIVDQRSYTSFDDTYPEGNIYWRVRAFDPSGNPLPWSSTRAVNKQSPTPQLNALPGVQGPTPTLSWLPLNFAASYELAIFQQASPTAKFTVTSSQVKWSASASSQSLAPGAYEWSVRRKDARSRFGGWSARKPLTISESLVTLNAPTANGTVAPRDSVFSWQAVARASDYRIILTSPLGAQTTQITKATAWAPLAKLTPGSWTWRVEARDTAGVAMGNPTQQTFVVSADFAATQATRIEGSGQLDTVLTGFAPVWTETPDSVTYQWFRGSTAVGDGTLAYTVTTADVGERITLRATGAKGGHVNFVSTSNAISGVQGAAPVAATPPTISGAGLVGETLTGNPPTWVQPNVTDSFRWLVNGASAGTAPTFTVRTSDIGKQIVFEVTGKRANYANAVVASAPVTGQPGGALQATVQPAISGTAVVGNSLTVAAGTWSQASPSFKYQWLRNGAPIPAATGSSYRLVPGDAGTGISATVLATKAGFADGAATATAVSIPKMASTTVAALSKTRVKPGTRVKIGIAVTVAGVAGPTGTIKVFDGAKVLKTLTLVSTRDGKLGWRLPKLKKGKHKIKAVYIGNTSIAGSKSKITKLYVVR